MGKKLVLFDFDGTIADTFYPLINVSNKLSKEFGYKKIKSSDISKLRSKHAYDVLRYLDFPLIKTPFIVKRVRLELSKKIKNFKTVKGIKKWVLELSKNNYKLGILTTNSNNNVTEFLKRNNLDVFDFVYSGTSIFGKNRMIQRILRIYNLKPESIIYIGDEIRDIEAAKKANVDVIAVRWGYNSKKILKKQKPDFFVDKPEDIIKVLNKIKKTAQFSK